MFTSKEPLRLQARQRTNLQAVIRSTRSPAGWARRAQVLLLLADKNRRGASCEPA
jgi:hypothetical protein